MKKIEIEFAFKGRHYDAVIRIRQRPGGRDFHITILDWELERLLYGNHIIKEEEGCLQANILMDKKEQTELKLTICGRLSSFLKIPCFAGDLCIGPSPLEEGWEDWHPVPRHLHHDPLALLADRYHHYR
jgi:hypothetical protein